MNELLEKYGKTLEDITFDYENLSDEELAALFEEHFGTPAEPVPAEPTVESMAANYEPEPEPAKSTVTYSVAIGDKAYTFEASLNDVVDGLWALVNDTYGSDDSGYYQVIVYEDYVVMVNYRSAKAYKQDYTVTDSNYSLVGERVEVYANYLTKEEEDDLAAMRQSYKELQQKVSDYETAIKKEILDSSDYSTLAESKEFEELKNNIDQYTIEQISEKADAILGRFSKMTFAAKSATPTKKVLFDVPDKDNEKKNPYGHLFDE